MPSFKWLTAAEAAVFTLRETVSPRYHHGQSTVGFEHHTVFHIPQDGNSHSF